MAGIATPLLYELCPTCPPPGAALRRWCLGRSRWRGRLGGYFCSPFAAILRKTRLAVDRHLAPQRLHKRHDRHHLQIVQLATQRRHAGLIAFHNINDRIVQRLDDILRAIAGRAFIGRLLKAGLGTGPHTIQVWTTLPFLANLMTQRTGPLTEEDLLPSLDKVCGGHIR